MTIPLQWHRFFGKTRRFEFTAGISYSRFIHGYAWEGEKKVEPSEKYSSGPRGSKDLLGITYGFGYTFLQRERFSLAVRYGVLWQVYDFQPNSHYKILNGTNFISSMLSVQCNMPLGK
ncbi:MAG: hypothetical protein JJU02_10960 [Cryomorphaceae bacterium]|nr:hypothetical protein [Cryomorphaceae bacterium]